MRVGAATKFRLGNQTLFYTYNLAKGWNKRVRVRKKGISDPVILCSLFRKSHFHKHMKNREEEKMKSSVDEASSSGYNPPDA